MKIKKDSFCGRWNMINVGSVCLLCISVLDAFLRGSLSGSLRLARDLLAGNLTRLWTFGSATRRRLTATFEWGTLLGTAFDAALSAALLNPTFQCTLPAFAFANFAASSLLVFLAVFAAPATADNTGGDADDENDEKYDYAHQTDFC